MKDLPQFPRSCVVKALDGGKSYIQPVVVAEIKPKAWEMMPSNPY